jgi:hypothetical protein
MPSSGPQVKYFLSFQTLSVFGHADSSANSYAPRSKQPTGRRETQSRELVNKVKKRISVYPNLNTNSPVCHTLLNRISGPFQRINARINMVKRGTITWTLRRNQNWLATMRKTKCQHPFCVEFHASEAPVSSCPYPTHLPPTPTLCTVLCYN